MVFKVTILKFLKKEYDYRCATCSSIEGKPHNIRKNEIIQLQEGRINPAKPLEIGNIIPQCQCVIVLIGIDGIMI